MWAPVQCECVSLWVRRGGRSHYQRTRLNKRSEIYHCSKVLQHNWKCMLAELQQSIEAICHPAASRATHLWSGGRDSDAAHCGISHRSDGLVEQCRDRDLSQLTSNDKSIWRRRSECVEMTQIWNRPAPNVPAAQCWTILCPLGGNMRGISQLLVDHNGTQNIDFCTDTEAVFESKV